MNYELAIERRPQKALARIAKQDREPIGDAIRGLAEDPRPQGAKKVTARDAFWLGGGDYRILYEIEDQRLLVFVVQVDHRREVCRR